MAAERRPGHGGVAVISGAGRGLGEAYARFLAARGWRLVISDIVGAAAEGVVSKIRDRGGNAVAGIGDASDPAICIQLVNRAVAEYGRIDAVVCNAGIVRDRTLKNMTTENWDDVIRTNLSSAFYMVKAVWPAFCDQEYGRLVLTTSVTGFSGSFGQANYAAAKMGLVGLTKTVALEGHRYGIRANAVAPVASTEMTSAAMSTQHKHRYSTAYVAPLVEFLLSKSCQMSGHVILAGGGRYRGVETRTNRGWSAPSPPTSRDIAREHLRLTRVPGAALPDPRTLLGS